MSARLCLFCKRFVMRAGWPGAWDDAPDAPTLRCSEGHWQVDLMADYAALEDRFREVNALAADCPDYEQIERGDR